MTIPRDTTTYTGVQIAYKRYGKNDTLEDKNENLTRNLNMVVKTEPKILLCFYEVRTLFTCSIIYGT